MDVAFTVLSVALQRAEAAVVMSYARMIHARRAAGAALPSVLIPTRRVVVPVNLGVGPGDGGEIPAGGELLENNRYTRR